MGMRKGTVDQGLLLLITVVIVVVVFILILTGVLPGFAERAKDIGGSAVCTITRQC